MEAPDATATGSRARASTAAAPAAPDQAAARPSAGEPGRPAHPIRPAPPLLSSRSQVRSTRQEPLCSARRGMHAVAWRLSVPAPPVSHHVQEVGNMTWLIVLALLLTLDVVAWRWGTTPATAV